MPKRYAIALDSNEGLKYAVPKMGTTSFHDDKAHIFDSFEKVKAFFDRMHMPKQLLNRNGKVDVKKYFIVRVGSKHWKIYGKMEDGTISKIRFIK